MARVLSSLTCMFQRSRYDSNEVILRRVCFFKLVVCVCVCVCVRMINKEGESDTYVLGDIIYIKLYRAGDRMEPCGTPGFFSRVIDISLLPKLNFLHERNQLISLIVLASRKLVVNLYNKPGTV
jgi:hypothetical protein